MGLSTAPASFMRLMENVLKGLIYKISYVYLDDIIIFSNAIEEHIERLRTVFKRLKEENLKLKPKKCVVLQEKIEFLGHIVTAEGIKPDNNKLKVVENNPTTKNTKIPAPHVNL